MEVRILKKQELLPALHLVWEVFAEDVAPSYPPEGVAEFQRFIKYDNMVSLYQRQEIVFFGVFENEELCGALALKNTGHISLFFVKKEFQKKGMGKMLYKAAYEYCSKQLRVGIMTVNAAPNAVVVYQHLGMRQTGAMQQMNGISFVPMETYVTIEKVATPADKKKKGLIIGGVAAGVILLILLTVFGVFLIKNIYKEATNDSESVIEEWENGEEDPMSPDSPIWDERGDQDEDDNESSGSDNTGMAAIPADIAPNLKYEIEEDSYSFTDEEAKSSVIAFDVKYPKLTGLDKKVQDQVNEKIKTCAMKTVDEIYTNPSQEFKEKILGTQNPIILSQVTYKVCYASNDFISIMFEDTGVKGSQNDSYVTMRTLNIGLKDGTVYEVKDIVELSDEFIEDWLDVMRDEADNEKFLSELTKKQMKQTLSGKSIDGNYEVNFFVDEDGIEIGYALDYEENDSNDLGYSWVTAPFTFKEMTEYEKNDDFWAFFD